MITRRSFLAGLAATPLYLWARDNAGTAQVKVGVCTKDAANAAKYGFDYIEPGAADIAAMTDDEFKDFSDDILASSL
ncbi:MAG TPA: hypothetical protein VG498_21860, partial [Terriglobales bacterium]|nr:hypothetical protein [Terriglobales bacterium]